MEDSILLTIKHKLGLPYDDSHFDSDIIIDINLALSYLNRLGIGELDESFSISGVDSKWTDLFETEMLNYIKEYVFLYVKLLFDPPSNSFLVDSVKTELNKLEWLINVDAEKNKLYSGYVDDLFVET